MRAALVTGASSGIGAACASRLVSAGWRVFAGVRGAGDAPQGTDEVLLDVTSEQQIRAAAKRIDRLDALVNNAGIAIFKPVLDTSFAEWQRVLSVNLNGAFNCTHACAPYMMKAGGGAIVNIASISGLRASTLRVAYGTSKAALIHLTKQYAVELGTAGIRVNCVAPGPVDTDMAKLVHSVAIRQDYYDIIPLNRYGTVDEIAATVAFLCSDDASYINGQTLAADGGFEAMGVGLPTLRRASGARRAKLEKTT
jgi:NAD(P)-dependent dehydrogenase (short-subunit alcohol dehydrogenase family)